jgi:hypothetical protein
VLLGAPHFLQWNASSRPFWLCDGIWDGTRRRYPAAHGLALVLKLPE